MYTKFSDLPKHKDRPSCEISTTVNIASDGTTWPIFMDGKPLHLESGDAAIYLGMELTHWREEFKGDWCYNYASASASCGSSSEKSGST
jgi:hypothetical protein